MMTMREELIEIAGDAIERAWNSQAREAAGLPPIDFIGSERDYLGAAVLDAILAGLDDPSEEMARAGHDHIAGDGDLETLFRAMLKPLKGE